MQNLGMQHYAEEVKQLQGAAELESQVRSHRQCHLFQDHCGFGLTVAVLVAEEEADSVAEGGGEDGIAR
jgi:hypothetical protein